MRHRQTGKICAMKVMRKSAVIKHGYVKHTNKEREILSDMSYHPFIVGSFGSMPCHAAAAAAAVVVVVVAATRSLVTSDAPMRSRVSLTRQVWR